MCVCVCACVRVCVCVCVCVCVNIMMTLHVGDRLMVTWRLVVDQPVNRGKGDTVR